MKYLAGVGIGCVALVAIVATCWAAGTFIVKTAWNAVVAGLLGYPELGTWEAFWLMLAIGLIGGAFRTTVTYAARARR